MQIAMQIFPRFSCTLYREEEYLMQEGVICTECLISGVSRGFSPAVVVSLNRG